MYTSGGELGNGRFVRRELRLFKDSQNYIFAIANPLIYQLILMPLFRTLNALSVCLKGGGGKCLKEGCWDNLLDCNCINNSFFNVKEILKYENNLQTLYLFYRKSQLRHDFQRDGSCVFRKLCIIDHSAPPLPQLNLTLVPLNSLSFPWKLIQIITNKGKASFLLRGLYPINNN